MSAPTGIVSFQPDEMTVRVRAGTTVSHLHDEFAHFRQRTALPQRQGGTVGGALAVGGSPIERLGRGHIRDSLLQAVFVAADGRLVTSGGPTIKNVRRVRSLPPARRFIGNSRSAWRGHPTDTPDPRL